MFVPDMLPLFYGGPRLRFLSLFALMMIFSWPRGGFANRINCVVGRWTGAALKSKLAALMGNSAHLFSPSS